MGVTGLELQDQAEVTALLERADAQYEIKCRNLLESVIEDSATRPAR